jgi:hypothetical protein
MNGGWGRRPSVALRQEVKPAIASPISFAAISRKSTITLAEGEVDADGHRGTEGPDDDVDRQRHGLVAGADPGLGDGRGRA